MKKILLIPIAVLSLYGCAMQSDLVDLENEVRRMKGILLETQRDVSNLQKSQRSTEQEQLMEQMKGEMAKIGGENRDMLDMLQKNQADFEVRFEQLAIDVQVIQGNIEENSHRLSELSASIDDQEAAVQELSRKMDIIEAKMTESPPPDQSALSPSGLSPGSPPGLPAGHSPEDTGTITTAPSDLYNQAYKDYLAGNYDLAIAGFSNYLYQTPTGNLAPNALYWVGECYYSKGDYVKAVTAFESVTIDYPKSDKVVGALLKMGYAYEKMGNKDMAIVYLKNVVERFPYSDEARWAKVRLTELK